MRKFVLLLLFISVPLQSQIENSSFESEGTFTKEGWTDECNYGSASDDVPENSGVWSLRLESGNYQGCYPAYFYQVIDNIKSGDMCRLTVQAKCQNSGYSYLRIGKKNLSGEISFFKSDSTESGEWTTLSLMTSVSLDKGDSAIVILHAGITSGPAGRHSLFDNVVLEILTDNKEPVYGSSINLSHPVPNPAENSVTFSYKLDNNFSIGYFIIRNLLGKELYRKSIAGSNNLNLDLSSLPVGMYFCRIISGNKHSAIRKLIITE